LVLFCYVWLFNSLVDLVVAPVVDNFRILEIVVVVDTDYTLAVVQEQIQFEIEFGLSHQVSDRLAAVVVADNPVVVDIPVVVVVAEMELKIVLLAAVGIVVVVVVVVRIVADRTFEQLVVDKAMVSAVMDKLVIVAMVALGSMAVIPMFELIAVPEDTSWSPG
jgi:hypothetical protein